MSIAEPLPPAVNKLQPLQKWYMLFPANWVELALDRDWRAKRLKDLTFNEGARHFAFWGIAGITCFLMLLLIIGGYVDGKDDLRSRLTTVLLFVNMLLMFVFQCVFYLKTEIERLLLQIIGRFDSRDIRHD